MSFNTHSVVNLPDCVPYFENWKSSLQPTGCCAGCCMISASSTTTQDGCHTGIERLRACLRSTQGREPQGHRPFCISQDAVDRFWSHLTNVRPERNAGRVSSSPSPSSPAAPDHRRLFVRSCLLFCWSFYSKAGQGRAGSTPPFGRRARARYSHASYRKARLRHPQAPKRPASSATRPRALAWLQG